MSAHTVLIRYTYDPLDRLASRTGLAKEIAQRFYKADQLVTEIQGTEHRTCLRVGIQLLAQKGQAASILLATDPQNSVLHAEGTTIAYAPYGHHEHPAVPPGLPGYNGEQPDPVTGHYLLGNGYRAYNPTLMRLNSPDSLSPFGEGGLNAYAYCVGDPVNRRDPTGHIPIASSLDDFVKAVLGQARQVARTPVKAASAVSSPLTKAQRLAERAAKSGGKRRVITQGTHSDSALARSTNNQQLVDEMWQVKVTAPANSPHSETSRRLIKINDPKAMALGIYGRGRLDLASFKKAVNNPVPTELINVWGGAFVPDMSALIRRRPSVGEALQNEIFDFQRHLARNVDVLRDIRRYGVFRDEVIK